MKNIPNILSSIRILMIPFIVYQYYTGNTVYAAIILAISGLTDLLDGFLARRYGWITQIGKVLDPAADKLTLIAVSVVLALKLEQHRVFFSIILIKDLGMLLIGGNLLRHNVKFSGAKLLGKVATAVFYVVMVITALFSQIQGPILTILFAIVLVLELSAAIAYVPEFIKYRQEKKENLKAER